MINSTYTGLTTWESLKKLIENPPKGSGAAYAQYRGTIRVLDLIVRLQGVASPVDHWVTKTDQALLESLRGQSVNASDVAAWRMEFGGPE